MIACDIFRNGSCVSLVVIPRFSTPLSPPLGWRGDGNEHVLTRGAPRLVKADESAVMGGGQCPRRRLARGLGLMEESRFSVQQKREEEEKEEQVSEIE